MMVIPAFSSTHGFGDFHIMDVSPATNGIVNQMPLLGLGVHPCCFVLVSFSEERVIGIVRSFVLIDLEVFGH